MEKTQGLCPWAISGRRSPSESWMKVAGRGELSARGDYDIFEVAGGFQCLFVQGVCGGGVLGGHRGMSSVKVSSIPYIIGYLNGVEWELGGYSISHMYFIMSLPMWFPSSRTPLGHCCPSLPRDSCSPVSHMRWKQRIPKALAAMTPQHPHCPSGWKARSAGLMEELDPS